MVRYEAKINGASGDEFISADIIIYDNEDQEIGTIYITDESKFNMLKEEVDNFNETYVSNDSLNSILENNNSSTVINATKINNMNGGEFVDYVKDQLSTTKSTPKSHASTTNTYGLGSSSEYGHVKTVNNLTTNNYEAGLSLSAYQGKILNDKIKSLESSLKRYYGLYARIGRRFRASSSDAIRYDGEGECIIHYDKSWLNKALYVQLYSPFGNIDTSGIHVAFNLESVTRNWAKQYHGTTDANGRAYLDLNLSDDQVMTLTAQAGGGDDFMATHTTVLVYYGTSTWVDVEQ